ncbi:MAG: glycosyltransferase [Bacteroidales bacterium]|nr:glycosyltransferase [Candidatus Physcousia equi]
MKIAIVIDTVIPVFAYGGTERVMWYLGQALHDMGHQVVFVAPKGSSCDFAQMVHINPALPVAQQIPADVDVVHFNNERIGDDFPKPYIVTWHGNFLQGELPLNSLFVSRNHAERHGSNQYVYNGMNWDDYASVDLHAPRTHFHFLGQAAWRQKNVRGAIDVVNRINKMSDSPTKLRIMGGHRLNLKHGIKFHWSRHADFMGMVGGQQKFDVLQRSRGFIFPVRWDEPFGIAITESLYFGSPVFATPYGSLPELVVPEVGYLCSSVQEMAEHIVRHAAYSPHACHEYARDVHNARVMAEAYLAKYEQVLNGETLNQKPPRSLQSDSKKLQWT